MAKFIPPVSPLAPKKSPSLQPIAGVRLATAEAGIKYKGRTDVLAIALDEGTTVAGVFTKSKCPSAPVDWCRLNLKGGTARAVVVNSGNANAFTGQKGVEAVELTAKIAAKALGCKDSEIFLASTGVIGEPLDASKFEPVLAPAFKAAKGDHWHEAAKAIMTTDTFAKLATASAEIDGVKVTIHGIAKGAGMIAPDMATMLSFVFTDAAIAPDALQALLSKGVKTSFNTVTVDSDTSTSDTLMLFATGKADHKTITDAKDPRLSAFRRSLNKVLLNLAEQVARDGEGARKLVKVQVIGAKTSKSAFKIAKSIADSPLVKTAVAGEDANWGRVVAAVGKAGEPAERDRLSIWFGDVRVAHQGARDPAYSEEAASAVMKKPVITIKVDIGLGGGKAQVMTCDLTKDYVIINGDYRS